MTEDEVSAVTEASQVEAASVARARGTAAGGGPGALADATTRR